MNFKISKSRLRECSHRTLDRQDNPNGRSNVRSLVSLWSHISPYHLTACSAETPTMCPTNRTTSPQCVLPKDLAHRENPSYICNPRFAHNASYHPAFLLHGTNDGELVGDVCSFCAVLCRKPCGVCSIRQRDLENFQNRIQQIQHQSGPKSMVA